MPVYKDEVMFTHKDCGGELSIDSASSSRRYDDEDEEIIITFYCEKCKKYITYRY
jgi:hypothetical protein